ncbi:unnamed protein product [Effrenium voratum]|nr:unnamed protein product [Effrenium voratum]
MPGIGVALFAFILAVRADDTCLLQKAPVVEELDRLATSSRSFLQTLETVQRALRRQRAEAALLAVPNATKATHKAATSSGWSWSDWMPDLRVALWVVFLTPMWILCGCCVLSLCIPRRKQFN